MAPSYKLTYFATKGWAEPIRFLFSYGDLDFEDVRIQHDQWLALKDQAPFGVLPMLEHEGRKAGQSVAISRYVAKKVQLAGKDDWEDLEIDAVVDSIKDGCLKISAIRAESDEEKRKAIKNNIVKEVFPNMLKCLERLTQENNGYLVLGRLTWADLYFVSLSDHLDIIAEYKVLKDYPNLEALKRNVLALSGIKKWVEKRPETSF